MTAVVVYSHSLFGGCHSFQNSSHREWLKVGEGRRGSGCPDKVRGRGLCGTHIRKPCSTHGCTTKATATGVCGKHGAYSCSTNARKGGFCWGHGGKDGFCTAPGCETPRVPGSRVCTKHGALGTWLDNGQWSMELQTADCQQYHIYHSLVQSTTP